jgi:tetratricopeptide (TPR) repeat protein
MDGGAMLGEHPDGCPDLEDLARLLKTEFGADVLRLALRQHAGTEAAGRWFERCERCAAHLRSLEVWQDELHHPDLEVVARERPLAWRLWSEMESLPSNRLKRAIASHHIFWGMAAKLLMESREALAVSPGRGILLAEMGIGVSTLLVGGYANASIAGLHLLAWVYLGNARRVAGQLRRADEAFERATDLLALDTGDPMIRGTYFDMLGSLRKDQRRFTAARQSLAKAVLYYQECDRPSLVGKVRLNQGTVAEAEGLLGEAIEHFTEAQRLINPAEEPVLFAHCQHHLVYYLIEVGQFEEAALRLPMARRQWIRLGNHRNLMKLRWAEGRMYQAVGHPEEARMAFHDVRNGLRASDSVFDYALLLLDEASLFVEEKNLGRVLELTRQAYQLLRQEGVQRECIAAVLQLRRAVEEQRVTRELVARAISVIRESRDSPGHRPTFATVSP